MGSDERSASRAYRSSRREAQARLTRRRVLDAATAVFLERAFAGSTMRVIASQAGVSVPTVELLFGTKGRLLKAAIDVAIVGDDDPVPVLDRSWTDAAVKAGTVEEFLVIVANVIGPAQERSAGLVLAAFEAASTDTELAELAGQMTAQRATTAGWITDQLTRKAPLREGCSRQEAIDTVWILMDPAVFDRLTRHRDWTLQQYQRWFTGSVGLLLIGDPVTRTHNDCSEARDMSRNNNRRPAQHPRHGQVGYLQLPAVDVARSAAFYESVFGWSTDLTYGSFEAPGMIGQWTTDRPSATTGGPVMWICADHLFPTLERAVAGGGTVQGRPQLDNAERWLAEIDDPAGNRIGIFVPVRPAQPQPMIAVRDVEASSRWYQQLLGLQSDHGGPEYERLLADGVLVLQLHHREVGHHHGRIGDPDREVGNGVLLWFGDVPDFDDAVARAQLLEAPIVRPPHRNPPEGEGNGPGHREIWIKDPDGYTVVIASPDGEAYEPR